MRLSIDVNKILLRVPNWIGDAVMSLPALSSLKKTFPSSCITVLAKPWVVPVYEKNPDVSKIIIYDTKERHNGINGKLMLAKELKAEGFHLAVLFQNAFEAALITFLADIPYRTGYSRDFRTPLLTHPVDLTKEILQQHQVYYYLNIIKELGDSPDKTVPSPKIYLEKEEMEKAWMFLKEHGVDEGDILFGVCPGASFGKAKMWKIEGFKEVMERLSKDSGAVPVIFGSCDDAKTAYALSETLPVRHLNLAGKTTLREFMTVSTFMRFLITNDSGPMHIVAALGLPTVAIFGSTEPLLTGPAGEKVRVINKKIACGPCFKRECPYGHYNCMAEVTADDVFWAVKSLITPV